MPDLYTNNMKLTFSDLFNEVGSHIVPKKNIRIGALVLPEGHPLDPLDPELGLPLNHWKSHDFKVEIDHDTVFVEQITPPKSDH